MFHFCQNKVVTQVPGWKWTGPTNLRRANIICGAKTSQHEIFPIKPEEVKCCFTLLCLFSCQRPVLLSRPLPHLLCLALQPRNTSEPNVNEDIANGWSEILLMYDCLDRNYNTILSCRLRKLHLPFLPQLLPFPPFPWSKLPSPPHCTCPTCSFSGRPTKLCGY